MDIIVEDLIITAQMAYDRANKADKLPVKKDFSTVTKEEILLSSLLRIKHVSSNGKFYTFNGNRLGVSRSYLSFAGNYIQPTDENIFNAKEVVIALTNLGYKSCINWNYTKKWGHLVIEINWENPPVTKSVSNWAKPVVRQFHNLTIN